MWKVLFLAVKNMACTCQRWRGGGEHMSATNARQVDYPSCRARLPTPPITPASSSDALRSPARTGTRLKRRSLMPSHRGSAPPFVFLRPACFAVSQPLCSLHISCLPLYHTPSISFSPSVVALSIYIPRSSVLTPHPSFLPLP